MPTLPIQQTFELAMQHHQAGRLNEAEGLYRQILVQQPGHINALHYLGVIAHQTGRNDLALDLIRQAIAIGPTWPEAHYNLAIVLKAMGRQDEAIAAFRQTLALRPDQARACFHLGVVLQASEQLDQAIAAYRQAIALQPNYPEAYNNLGVALARTGQYEPAIAAFRQFIMIKPNAAEGQYNLGNALQAAGQLGHAIVAFRQAIVLKPDYLEVYSNLGLALANSGQLDEAITVLRQAITLNPKAANAEGFTNLLYALYHHPGCSSMELLEVTRQWARQQPVVSPGYFPNRDRSPDRKLKIGYVSGSFVMSADAHFTLPLLAHHDRKQFEIFGYSRAGRHDEFTQRLRSHCDHWIDICQLGTQAAVELIRSHEIDILVNVSNTGDLCRTLFASRMAPIQMIWLIFASCTSGLETVDYRISDPFVDAVGMDETCYSEQTLRLPETAWCYDPLVDSLPVEPPPVIGNGFVTFGSLHRLIKLNPSVLATWVEILRATPNARLLIQAVAGSAREHLLDQFQQLGVDRGRIDCIGKLPRREYLKQFHRIDVLLDTFPFAGHTTAFDSLWMGVPVVTLSGGTLVSRAAASTLENLKLGELIGRTREEYVQIAVKLANDLPRLKELRLTLRQRMENSPLMDAPRFARNFESVYRQVWHRYCATGDCVKA